MGYNCPTDWLRRLASEALRACSAHCGISSTLFKGIFFSCKRITIPANYFLMGRLEDWKLYCGPPRGLPSRRWLPCCAIRTRFLGAPCTIRWCIKRRKRSMRSVFRCCVLIFAALAKALGNTIRGGEKWGTFRPRLNFLPRNFPVLLYCSEVSALGVGWGYALVAAIHASAN